MGVVGLYKELILTTNPALEKSLKLNTALGSNKQC